MELLTYRIEVRSHLLASGLSIALAKHGKQPPVSFDGGASRFGAAADAVMDGLHVAQARQGGLQDAISRGVGDGAVEVERKSIECLWLVDNQL